MSNPIAALLGLESPHMTEQEMEAHLSWQLRLCRAAFTGDDGDATAASDMLDRIESWFTFLHSANKDQFASRILVDAMTPYSDVIPKILSSLCQIAIVRMQALGIAIPEHPLDKRQDTTTPFNPNGWMPPMGEAG